MVLYTDILCTSVSYNVIVFPHKEKSCHAVKKKKEYISIANPIHFNRQKGDEKMECKHPIQKYASFKFIIKKCVRSLLHIYDKQTLKFQRQHPIWTPKYLFKSQNQLGYKFSECFYDFFSTSLGLDRKYSVLKTGIICSSASKVSLLFNFNTYFINIIQWEVLLVLKKLQ